MSLRVQQRYDCVTGQTIRETIEIPDIAPLDKPLTIDEQIDKRLKDKGLIA